MRALLTTAAVVLGAAVGLYLGLVLAVWVLLEPVRLVARLIGA